MDVHEVLCWGLVLCHVLWCVCAGDWSMKDRNATGVILEYCESETFRAKCAENHVVVMGTAVYGRMHIGRCVTETLGYLGCNRTVLSQADEKCSGRDQCEIRIPDGKLDESKPCFKELKVYLEASYDCISVVHTKELCKTSKPIQASSSGSYISSRQLYLDQQCRHPNNAHAQKEWTLKSQPGQTLNITLLDFDWDPNVNRPYKDQPQYGYLLEKVTGRNISIMGHFLRQQHLLLTNGSSAHLVLNITEGRNFLIKFTALGCADLRPPKDAWLKRPSKNEAIVGCNDTRQTWHLKCEGRSWIGVIGNCTQHLVAARKQAMLRQGFHHLPHDVTIVIIVGISLLICALIVMTGLVCIKRLSKKPCCQGGRQVKYDNVKTEDVLYKEQQDPSYLSPKYSQGKDSRPGGRKPKNDYSHIWEHPLPDPENNRSQADVTAPQQLKVKLPAKESRGSYNVNNNTESGSNLQTYHVSMASKSSDGESKYFVLDKEVSSNQNERGEPYL